MLESGNIQSSSWKGVPKRGTRQEIFIDQSEWEQGSCSGRLLIGESRVASLHGVKWSLGEGNLRQVTWVEQESSDWLI